MSRSLSRRGFVASASVMLSLPFLPSLLPRSARAQDKACNAPRRLLAYYVPCGINMAEFRPQGEGVNWTAKRILEPIYDLKDDISILTGLENNAARSDGAGDHAAGTGAFFTAAHCFKSETVIRNGISVDQVAAEKLGSCTPLRSLQLGIDGGGSTGGCDSGYSCAYTRNISWASETQPLPKITDPRVAFDLLFAGYDSGASEAEAARRRALRKSVLDYALGEAAVLKGKLGADDKLRLEEFTSSVRDLELRIDAISGNTLVCEVPDRPDAQIDFVEHMGVMTELMALALQCDRTRIVTFMLGNGGSGRNYDFIDASGGHHSLSHHGGDPTNLEKLTRIARFEVEQFAALARRLSEMTDVGGTTVLQNSLMFFSSEISDGDRHNHNDMPIILAGGGGGTVKTGRHIVYKNEEKVSNLFISMLSAFGVQLDSFGEDGDGPLAGLAG